MWILGNLFCHYNKPAVWCGVFAGRKRDKPVAVFCGHTCIIQGKLLALGDISVKVIFVLCVNKIVVAEACRAVRNRFEHGNDFILAPLCEGIKANGLVFLVKSLALVILQCTKHLLPLDVMTVNNKVIARQ